LGVVGESGGGWDGAGEGREGMDGVELMGGAVLELGGLETRGFVGGMGRLRLLIVV